MMQRPFAIKLASLFSFAHLTSSGALFFLKTCAGAFSMCRFLYSLCRVPTHPVFVLTLTFFFFFFFHPFPCHLSPRPWLVCIVVWLLFFLLYERVDPAVARP